MRNSKRNQTGENKLKLNSGKILIALAICFCFIGTAVAEDYKTFEEAEYVG